MMKREKKALIVAILTVCIIAIIGVIMLVTYRPFRTKGQVFAAELSVTDFIPDNTENTEKDINSIVEYFVQQGRNTVIAEVNTGKGSVAVIPGFEYIYSDNAFIAETDVIKAIKKHLEKNGIQLYLAIDCTDMMYEDVCAISEYIRKEYHPAAIVLKNTEEGLFSEEKLLKNSIIRTDLLLQSDDAEQIENIIYKEMFDGFICESANANDYIHYKSLTDKPIYLYYKTYSFKSDTFALINFYSLDGVVGGKARQVDVLPFRDNSIFQKTEGLPAFGFAVPQQFDITYPTKDVSTYYKGIFITGTGTAGEKVSINGKDYDTENDGTFGIYLELAEGENTLVITQGENSVVRTVTRKVYASSPSGTVSQSEYIPPWDDSKKVGAGQIVQTTGLLTSMLSDPDDDSAIMVNIEQGVKLCVVENVQTQRNGKSTWAYKLSNGGYILSSKVELLNEITDEYKKPKKLKKEKNTELFIPDRDDAVIYDFPVIQGCSIKKLAGGDELAVISVNNYPAVISDYKTDSLTLHFLDTKVEDIKVSVTALIENSKIEEKENGTLITFNYSEKNAVWGYDITYTENSVQIYLKAKPQLSQGDKPLTGITVMLDSGHGGYDSGALGVASTLGPVEKQLNLAIATATKALLEEYGAYVVMTREDDIYLSLDERRNYIREIKPDLFISVHHNSMDYSYNSTNAVGSECYYFTKQSRQLAENLCKNISQSTNRLNRGAKNGYYYVTRTDIAPSALMEYGFIINAEEFSKTYSDINIYKAAFGTLQAVLETIPE